jgi:hypothetical protein
VIIVGCDCFPASAASTFSVKDTAGLTFTSRAVIGIGGNQFVHEWYAIAPGRLSSDMISVTTTDTERRGTGSSPSGYRGQTQPTRSTLTPYSPPHRRTM